MPKPKWHVPGKPQRFQFRHKTVHKRIFGRTVSLELKLDFCIINKVLLKKMFFIWSYIILILELSSAITAQLPHPTVDSYWISTKLTKSITHKWHHLEDYLIYAAQFCQSSLSQESQFLYLSLKWVHLWISGAFQSFQRATVSVSTLYSKLQGKSFGLHVYGNSWNINECICICSRKDIVSNIFFTIAVCRMHNDEVMCNGGKKIKNCQKTVVKQSLSAIPAEYRAASFIRPWGSSIHS